MMRTAALFLALFHLVVTENCANRKRREVMWYFDEQEKTCFAYPINCYTPLYIRASLYHSEEECALNHMSLLWKTYTLSCPFSLQLATFSRSNGDQVPYIFSPQLCRMSGGRLVSDLCTSSEFCYKHKHFAFCCNIRAFVGTAPVLASGRFTISGIGGPAKHIKGAVFSPPPPEAPSDCNEDGDRNEIEWYPKENMACVARRSDCESPGFPIDVVNDTYATQQECMDVHFADWMMSYKLTCSEGYAPATIGDSPLIFSRSLCGSWHHSDICNHDEYCSFSNRTSFAFCCRRSEQNATQKFVIYGNLYRRQRHRRQARFIDI
ncbi:hypothetical protein Q1695_001876 [Nippostrongylus brasiliensis]|nr:hypothetical protein Q1695_001876 [Nippostrongylus brasiliensis]